MKAWSRTWESPGPTSRVRRRQGQPRKAITDVAGVGRIRPGSAPTAKCQSASAIFGYARRTPIVCGRTRDHGLRRGHQEVVIRILAVVETISSFLPRIRQSRVPSQRSPAMAFSEAGLEHPSSPHVASSRRLAARHGNGSVNPAGNPEHCVGSFGGIDGTLREIAGICHRH